jgi:hypothetical protein
MNFNGGKKRSEAKAVGGKAKKADEATEVSVAETDLLLRLLSNYENNHSIKSRISYL